MRSHVEQRKGRSGKVMGKSGEIKTGDERNGLLCTKTCKTAPNWVLDEKNKQSTLVYTSQVNLLAQHIVWEFKSIIPRESMLLRAAALIHGWTGDALSSSMGKAGRGPPRNSARPRHLAGDSRRAGGSSATFGKHSRAGGVQLFHTSGGSPESPLNPCIP